MTTAEVLQAAQRGWDVYHINLMDYSGCMSNTQSSWKELLGDHFINTENGSGDDIAGIISGIILKSAGTAWTSTKEEPKEEKPVETTTTTTHIR